MVQKVQVALGIRHFPSCLYDVYVSPEYILGMDILTGAGWETTWGIPLANLCGKKCSRRSFIPRNADYAGLLLLMSFT